MALTTIENVADIVAVEPGRRTAQMAVNAAGARVVVFAFDTGAELAQHTAPGPILVQALEGRLTFSAHGETVEIRPGDLLHLDARVPHAVTALEPSKMMLTIIHQDWAPAGA